jgi:hypothetical protein
MLTMQRAILDVVQSKLAGPAFGRPNDRLRASRDDDLIVVKTTE